MNFDTEIHHRRTIRLKGYDYSQQGYYFVTICTQNYENLFGDVIDGKMILNDSGLMVEKLWEELPLFYSDIVCDKFVIMPNHIHGIILIKETTRLSLSDIVQRVKSLTTKKYIDNVKQKNWNPFNKRLWQRNYYEHIIRDKNELHNIRNYIVNNPLKWELDRENPNCCRGNPL